MVVDSKGVAVDGVSTELQRRIAVGLYECGLFRTWFRDRPQGWTLVSGLWSPIYLQLRELSSHPALLRDVGDAVGQIVRREVPDAAGLVGIAYGGIPVAIAASLASEVPAVMTRKPPGRKGGDVEARLAAYGQHASVEGLIEEDSRLVLVDDLVTGFDSKLLAARQLAHEAARRGLSKVECRDVVVVVDREQGGAEAARSHGFSLHAAVKLRSDALRWLQPKLAPVEYEVVSAYLDDPAPFQAVGEQERLRGLSQRKEG